MNLEHLLTDEQRQIRETLREFTRKEIIPNTKKLEADYHLVEEVLQKLVDMGFQSMRFPVEYGGNDGRSGEVLRTDTRGVLLQNAVTLWPAWPPTTK